MSNDYETSFKKELNYIPMGALVLCQPLYWMSDRRTAVYRLRMVL